MFTFSRCHLRNLKRLLLVDEVVDIGGILIYPQFLGSGYFVTLLYK